MCDRYGLKVPKKAFDGLKVVPAFDLAPRFNIAPIQPRPGRLRIWQDRTDDLGNHSGVGQGNLQGPHQCPVGNREGKALLQIVVYPAKVPGAG